MGCFGLRGSGAVRSVCESRDGPHRPLIRDESRDAVTPLRFVGLLAVRRPVTSRELQLLIVVGRDIVEDAPLREPHVLHDAPRRAGHAIHSRVDASATSTRSSRTRLVRPFHNAMAAGRFKLSRSIIDPV